MRPRTRTATSSEEPSPIHFDHSHPWNANDRRGQGLVLELVGFQVTFLRHLLADLLRVCSKRGVSNVERV